MLGGGAQAETGPQDNQGHRSGGGGHFPQGLKHRARQVQVNHAGQTCEDCPQDHGVLEDILDGGPKLRLATSAGFQGDDGQDIVDGHDEGDHHGGDGQLVAAEDIADDGDAQQHEVAAEDGLGHGSPPQGHFFLKEVGRAHAQEEKYDDSQAAEDDEFGPEGGVEVCQVKIVEHHNGEKDLEDHAVHMVQLRFRQELQGLDYGADANEDEKGHHSPQGDEEIAGHRCFTSFCCNMNTL